jgi:hypothetical protein
MPNQKLSTALELNLVGGSIGRTLSAVDHIRVTTPRVVLPIGTIAEELFFDQYHYVYFPSINRTCKFNLESFKTKFIKVFSYNDIWENVLTTWAPCLCS